MRTEVPAPPLPVASSPLLRTDRSLKLPTPQLSVVIVNYCQWADTAALVRSVVTTPAGRRGEVEVVVVDNHSPRHCIIPRLRRWPGVSLRRWRRNHGFARAANEGARLSLAPWVLLLNPDITLPPGFLDRALSLTRQLTADEPRTGIVGVQLRHADGTRQHSVGSFPTLWNTLAGLLQPRARRKCRPRHARRRCRVPWVTGCCLLVRRDCLRDLGGFDERFFLYYEDVDLCRRAWTRGWQVCYEPGLCATHHRPLHRRTVAPPLRLVTRHSLLTYARLHWPRWHFHALAWVVRLEGWIRRWWALYHGCKSEAQASAELATVAADLARNRPNRARRRVRAIMDPLVR
ncbi:MAG: glycosyltransferase family 2 protein [Gemmataceae bacterium]|nr:glycosyltransferase family 2 protein [Gemmataceae bacterium]MDW8265533.1 glycosyltransferase family 2 protein [Gemmataceae bacterium]